MKPVKIAMVSLTHGHTRKYYQTLRENSKLDWVASCAEDERAKEVYELYKNGVPCYLSIDEMFEKHPDIEAVVLASANDKHLEQVKDCARRGVHVLSMKIPTFDPKEYDEMVEAVEKAGIVCQVELEMHYNPVVKRLQEIIESGKLGKILSVQATNITLSPVWAFPWQGSPEASYGKRVPLRDGDPRFRGGALCDHPHIFDLIRWLTKSDFDFVYSEVAPNIRPDLEVEDMILANGKMKNGVIFSLDPSWSIAENKLKVPGPGWEVFPKRMEVNVTITGEKGVVACDCFGPNVYHNGAPNDRFTVQYTYFDEWIGLIDEFVACIREHKEPKINLKWHRGTIDAMNACYASIQTKAPAKV
ncbi:MAG: Gfo/Idh/MocA family oxidoreductase [Lentisphaeria bacterium]|nr:Gfo/Idh/MocA family oxidoreductase [Lentisphaeria bacterium]